jgi:hypothetical protein
MSWLALLRQRQRSLSLSLSLALAFVAPSAIAAAGTVVLQDDFARDEGWLRDKGEGEVRFNGGAVSIQALGLKGTEPSITRRFLLSPAASYRVDVQVAVSQQTDDTAVAAVVLAAPSGDALTVNLSVKDQNIRVTYWRNSAWADAALPWRFNAAIKAEPGQINRLSLTSQGGRLAVNVNGVEVGRTRVLDFAPSAIGLVGEKLRAEFRELRIVETGTDARQARQQLLLPVPGQRTLVYDNLQPDAALLKKLGSLGLTQSDALPAWPLTMNHVGTRLTRDTQRQVLTMQADAGRVLNAFPGNYTPLGQAGISAHARLNLLKLVAGDDCVGIEIAGRAADAKVGQGEDTDSLLGCISQSRAMIYHYQAKTQKWVWLAGEGLILPKPQRAELRLVWTPQSVVLFVDGRFHASADNPAGFEALNFGLRIDGDQLIELTEFRVSEI